MVVNVMFVCSAREDLWPHAWRRRHGGNGGGETSNERTCDEWGSSFNYYYNTWLFFTGESDVIYSKLISFVLFCIQVDTNKDRLVSLDEFMVATNKKEFAQQDRWEVLFLCFMLTSKENWIKTALPKTVCLFLRLWSKIQSTLKKSWESLKSIWFEKSKTSTRKQMICWNSVRSWRDSSKSLMHKKHSYNR